MTKNFYALFAVALLATASQAQVQNRLVLAEEFTQASCPPCASQNPAFNTLLTANAAKVISIKYQTSWPGVDPMNAHNPTQVATRVTYYGVTGVPEVALDGATVGSGAPSAITTTVINNRYAVPAKYNVTVSHTINAALTNVAVHAVIRLNDAGLVGNANLRAHIAVVEKAINFGTAPGTNGEKDFYSVMKKMLPSDQGTSVPAPTAVGDSLVIDQNWNLANVYDINQLGVVVFVQDNATKEVHQAAYSAPQAVIADVAAASATSNKAFMCGANRTASISTTIRNGGPQPLTSCTLRFEANGAIITDIPWTGSLTTGSTAVSTNNITVPAGTSYVKVSCINANTGDQNALNDVINLNIAVPQDPSSTMPSENFAATAFPPATVTVAGGTDAYNWQRYNTAAAGAAGSGSAMLRWFNIAANQQDHMYLQPVDLSGSVSASLTFDVAYAQYSTAELDNLVVRVSTNCGATFTNVYSKSGPTLATSAIQTAAFYPTTAAMWRTETIDLSAYNGQSNLLIDFLGISKYGNNGFVDNINVSRLVSVDDTKLESHANVFPNPTEGKITANIAIADPTDMTISVTNALGQEVARQQFTKTLGGNFDFDLTAQPNGNYFVHITTDSAKTTKKVTVQH